MQDLERIPSASNHQHEDDLDLWSLAKTLWRHWKLIGAITAVGTIGAAVFTFSQPNIYTASATIMPVDSSSDRLSSALSSLGALGGLASQAGVGLKGSVSDKFVALLKSRTIAENVITNNDLLPVLFSKQWDSQSATWKPSASILPWANSNEAESPTMHQALRSLRRIVSTKADSKAGLIEISAEHTNPQVAADIANHFVLELNSYLRRNTFTAAKQNREFLEGQLKIVKTELKTLENELKSFQEANKLVSLDGQVQASVQAYAELKSQLIAKEMEISLQEKSASENDIFLVALRQEVAQLKAKLAALENGESSGFVSFKDAPTLGMRFAQLTRDIMVRQEVFKLLTQQYELSKIEEAKETLSFQVIDSAIAPDQKSKPNRLRGLAMGAMFSLFLGGLAAIGLEKFKPNKASA